MKKGLIIVITLITVLMLSSCNDKRTLPVNEITYPLYSFDGSFAYDILDLTNQLDYHDYIYISGIFDKDGTPTLMSYGYEVERDRYWVFGEKECNDCSYISLVNDIGYTPFIIYNIDDIYYIENVINFGSNEALIYNDYTNYELLSDYLNNPVGYNNTIVLDDYQSITDYIEDYPTGNIDDYTDLIFDVVIDEDNYIEIIYEIE